MSRERPEPVQHQQPAHQKSKANAARRTEHVSVRRTRVETRESMTLNLELARRRVVLGRMETAHVEADLVAETIRQLLSDKAFIATLTNAGFRTVSRILCEEPPAQSIMNHPSSYAPVESPTAARCDPDLAYGFCDEAASILAGKTLPARTVLAIRQMREARQVAAIGLMCADGNFSGDFARALLAATPRVQRVAGFRETGSIDDQARQLARTERQILETLERIRYLSEGYNKDLVYLAVAGSCIRSWMCIDEVATWIRTKYLHLVETCNRVARAADDAKPAKRPMKLPYGNERIGGATNQRTRGGKQRSVRVS